MPIDEHAQYWIARGSETFGPYTGSQVRAYVASGNIAPSDRIRRDSDLEWSTVAATIAGHAAPPPIGGIPPTHGAPGLSAGLPDATDEAKAFAYVSLGLGIVGLLCCGVVTAIPGVIFGILAINKPTGPSRGIAIAGLVVSVIALLLGIVAILVLLFFPQFLPQGFTGPGGLGNP